MTHLHFAKRVQELVVAVGEHVQLVAGVTVRLLLGLGQAGLVARRQLDVYLHVLRDRATEGRQRWKKKNTKHHQNHASANNAQ